MTAQSESAQDEAQQYAEQAEEKDALADLQRRYGNGPTRQGETA